MPESIETSKFVSHRARMSADFDLSKDSHSTKLEWRPLIFVKLSFRELCGSKLSHLSPFNIMAIIQWVKICQKQESRMWVNETPIIVAIFVTLNENSSVKWHPGTSKISKPTEIGVVTHFHERHATKTIPAFLPTDGEASWLPVPSLVFLLSGSTLRPEKTCFCILKVMGQAWETKKRISVNTYHRHHC